MHNGSGIFLIARSGENDGSVFYARHGRMGSVAGAVGYDDKGHAKKFLSEADAAKYIATQMPVWARKIHHVAELSEWDVFTACPALYAARSAGTTLDPALLEASGYRLLIWRR